jgi:hypothetical protein
MLASNPSRNSRPELIADDDAAHPPVARIPSPPLQLGSDPRPAITRKLQSNALDLVPQIQILRRPALGPGQIDRRWPG